MKYALFVYDEYYPQGGWNDLFGVYETFEKANSQYKKLKKKKKYDFFQIVNLETGTVRLDTDNRQWTP